MHKCYHRRNSKITHMIFTQLLLGSGTARLFQTFSRKHTEFSDLAGHSRVSSLAKWKIHCLACTHLTQRLPDHAILNNTSRAYHQYSFSIIPLLGTILAGDRESYQYLVESIRRFPPQNEFTKMIQDAGFATGKEVDGGAWTNLWGGVACIHTGIKV